MEEIKKILIRLLVSLSMEKDFIHLIMLMLKDVEQVEQMILYLEEEHKKQKEITQKMILERAFKMVSE